jgi:hypothetical protein
MEEAGVKFVKPSAADVENTEQLAGKASFCSVPEHDCRLFDQISAIIY